MLFGVVFYFAWLCPLLQAKAVFVQNITHFLQYKKCTVMNYLCELPLIAIISVIVLSRHVNDMLCAMLCYVLVCYAMLYYSYVYAIVNYNDLI